MKTATHEGQTLNAAEWTQLARYYQRRAARCIDEFTANEHERTAKRYLDLAASCS